MIWLCRVCGHRAETDDDKVAYFHHCHPPQRRRRYSIPEVENVTTEELRTALWEGFADSVGDESLYRGVDE